jgi:hypothetical protein
MARNTVAVAPYQSAALITTSDTVAIASGVADGVYCGTGGTISFVDQQANVVATTAVAGQIIPVRIMRVNLTGTASSGLVALYL